MRTGLAASLIGHVLLIAWGVFSLFSPEALKVDIDSHASGVLAEGAQEVVVVELYRAGVETARVELLRAGVVRR